MMEICKEKVAKYAIICIMLHFIKCDIFFLKTILLLPNKILNILLKQKKMIISTASYFKSFKSI
jgi:hypothetical protein